MSAVEWPHEARDDVDLALHADDCPGGDLGEYRQPGLKVGTAPDMVRAWLRGRADRGGAS